MPASKNSLFQLAVIVSALGFFVDVYDLLLFGIIRKPSLQDLGLSPEQILKQGEFIISVQMIGLLIGGILWGVLGDKKGRLKVLFGSILLYSVANILNGMVTNTTQYAILRFIAGIGLAGELGAGITLVNELLPKEKRGIASAMIASFGILGAVTAFFMKELFDWRTCYYIGGVMGLVLLVLRVSVTESDLYKHQKAGIAQRGNFFMFFTNRERFVKYMRCILIGLPAWYIIGVLITFSDQFGEAFGINNIDPGKAIMVQYLAIAFGDLSVGLLSQKLRSRKKALFIFYGITIFFLILYFLQSGGTETGFLPDLLWSGLWNRVHCCLHYHECGTIWNQPSCNSSDQYSEYGAWRFAFNYPVIPVYQEFFRKLYYGWMGYWPGIDDNCHISAWKMEETYGKDLDFIEQ